MQKNIVLFFFIACVVMSCGNNNSSKEERPAEKAAAAPPVYKMDMLEKIFNNDNWMKTGGFDTTYFYFSRISSSIRVHWYRMEKGDSVIINMSDIHFSDDSLIWQYNDSTRLFLRGITEKQAGWAHVGDSPGSLYMVFDQKDDKHITVSFADKKQFILTRTPTLSTFLVRSRYDYLHGTNYAFSDTVFSTGKKK